ncbi:MAG: hypothetical protein BYD32DRAFT_433024 [Podila humilis]|nr:MAG: hypothetical protein BYD32DRAFT_433024 [Podila humilis]
MSAKLRANELLCCMLFLFAAREIKVRRVGKDICLPHKDLLATVVVCPLRSNAPYEVTPAKDNIGKVLIQVHGHEFSALRRRQGLLQKLESLGRSSQSNNHGEEQGVCR